MQRIEFTAPFARDPRPALVAELIEITEGAGDLIVHIARFKRCVLRSPADPFPANEIELADRISRLVDWLVPFQQRLNVDRAMGGSLSLRNVLPVLPRDLSCTGMPIQDGALAMDSDLQLGSLEMQVGMEANQEALSVNCELDTLAMVGILEALRQAVHTSATDSPRLGLDNVQAKDNIGQAFQRQLSPDYRVRFAPILGSNRPVRCM